MKSDLPSNWRYESLGKCCYVISGATPRRDVSEYWGGGIPWVTPKDISKLDGQIIENTPEDISEKGYKSCSSTILPEGSVLFSSRAPIGLVALTGRPMCTNQGFKSLVPKEGLNSKYLYHCMKWVAPKLKALGNGATFKEVSKEVVSRFEIPFPPLSEQKRIAAILDKADAIRRKRQQAIKLADDFLRATFLDMFGDPVTNSKRWELRPLGEIVNFKTGKLDSNAAIEGGIYPFFTCSQKTFKIDKYAFDCEALLLAGNNAAADYSVKYYNGKFNAYQRTYVITVKNEQLTYQYLKIALELKLQNLKRLSKGTNTKYLTLDVLQNIIIQVPSKESLEQFDFKFGKTHKSICLLKKAYEAAESLNKSISNCAFSGRL